MQTVNLDSRKVDIIQWVASLDDSVLDKMIALSETQSELVLNIPKTVFMKAKKQVKPTTNSAKQKRFDDVIGFMKQDKLVVPADFDTMYAAEIEAMFSGDNINTDHH